MAAEQPYWAPCGRDGCIGVRLPTTGLCLNHAAEQGPDAFEAELERIGVDGTVDARGVGISAELLRRLLAAAPRKDDRPALADARFQRATFEGERQLRRGDLQGRAVFDQATFKGEAGFGQVTFQGGAWFTGASFQGETWFTEATFRDKAVFDQATFKDGAYFTEASFQG